MLDGACATNEPELLNPSRAWFQPDLVSAMSGTPEATGARGDSKPRPSMETMSPPSAAVSRSLSRSVRSSSDSIGCLRDVARDQREDRVDVLCSSDDVFIEAFRHDAGPHLRVRQLSPPDPGEARAATGREVIVATGGGARDVNVHVAPADLARDQWEQFET